MTLQSILVCPYCGVQNRCPPQYAPQSLKCGKCKKPLSNQVETSCPNCDRTFSAEPGDVYCPACARHFEIDESGMVVHDHDSSEDADETTEITCPGCDDTFEDETPGEVTCPHCGDTFEVDDAGDVLAADEDEDADETELELSCPACRGTWKDNVPGCTTCYKCGYSFDVNEEGKPVGGENGYRCPHCGTRIGIARGKEARGYNCSKCHRSLVPKETDYQCPHCGADNYLASGSDPSQLSCYHCKESLKAADDEEPEKIDITCPVCNAEWKDEAPGWLTCPICDHEFEVDEEGDPIDEEDEEGPTGGKPLCSVMCPECGEEWDDEAPGDVQCPGCQHEFKVDEDGVLVLEMHEDEDEAEVEDDESSDDDDSLPGDYPSLLSAARPALYCQNAFHLCRLRVDASDMEISRQLEKIGMMEKLNGGHLTTGGLYHQGDQEPADALREAKERLKNPETRLLEEFFWFWPHAIGRGAEDDALQCIARNDIKSAEQIWLRQEQMQSANNVSVHNLAVLYHAEAIELERRGLEIPLPSSDCQLRDRYWKNSLSRWRMILEQDSFWHHVNNRIRQFDDPRLTARSALRLRHCLPLALLSVNAQLALLFAQKGNRDESLRLVQIMSRSGFDEGIRDDALQRAVVPVREQIRLLCANAKSSSVGVPTHARQATKDLLQNTAAPLKIMSTLLPDSHYVRTASFDEVAKAAYDCLYAYFKVTEDWATSLDFLKKIQTLAASESTKAQIESSAATVRSNLVWQKYGNAIYSGCDRISKYMKNGHETAKIQFKFLQNDLLRTLQLMKSDPIVTAEEHKNAVDVIICTLMELSLYFNNECKAYDSALEAIELASQLNVNPDLKDKLAQGLNTIRGNRAAQQPKSGCFIATAVYEDTDAPQVRSLRAFRDDILLRSRYGTRFVRAYYRLSPHAARLISRHEPLRRLGRVLLQPIVELCKRIHEQAGTRRKEV